MTTPDRNRDRPERSRSENTLRKLKRMHDALNRREPDRVPISDFFWNGFKERWRKELDLPDDADPYRYYDLDWIVTVPNLDPRIRQFEILEENDRQIVLKTGYGAVLRKKFDCPMPEFVEFETDTLEKLEAFAFDDPHDRRRYFEAGDNQIAGVGDGVVRDSPAWVETVESLRPDFPVFGSVCEVSEHLARLIGQENTFLWMGMHPDRFGECVNRIGRFALECARAQLTAAAGRLDGFVIWGDVAYVNGMYFSPDYWRAYFKPWIQGMTDLAHEAGVPVIYHGCGNTRSIFADFIEMGVEGYNPLEVKAGMDMESLRREYGHAICFCGGSDVQVWEKGDPARVRAEVLRRLRAGKGGGLIFQSDHSVTSDVSGKTYDYIVELVREYGRYPLKLDERDEMK